MRLGALENASKSRPFLINEFIWRRIPLVVIVGAPLFLLILLLLSPFFSPIYRSDGVFLIKQGVAPRLNGGQERSLIEGDIATYQQTLVTRILDRGVLSDALRHLEDSDRPNFLKGLGASELAVEKLRKKLVAAVVPQTYLIDVSLDASSPKGLAPALNAVLNSLITELQGEQEEQHVLRLEYLEQEKSKVTQLLDERREKIVSLANQYADKSFLRANYGADLTKVEMVQRLYLEAQSDMLAKEALLKRSIADKEKVSQLNMVSYAQEKAMDNLGISEIESYTYTQSQQLRAQIDGLTPENPDRIIVEARMKAMNEYLDNFKRNYKENTFKTLTEKRAYELEDDVIRATNAYKAAQQNVEVLREKYLEAIKEGARTSEGLFELSDLNAGVTQLRERRDAISLRIDDEELQAKSPLPVVINQKAKTPLSPTSSNAKSLLYMAILISFGTVGAGSVLIDFFGRNIRSRKELGAAIGGLGAEPIPALLPVGEDPLFSQKDTLMADHPAAFALRDLALRLVIEHQRNGAKVFAFVGAHTRSGNTSIALNVARAISAHGFGVLLAELPTSTPGLASAVGLSYPSTPPSPWGNKSTDNSSAVQIIPWIPGVSRNKVRASLDQFLESASEVAEFVLLDLVPLSLSDIAREASIKSDVVVITAAQEVANFDEVRSTVEWVVAGGVSAVTTVLNFARPDRFQTQVQHLLSALLAFTTQLHNQLNDWASSKVGSVVAVTEKNPVYQQFVTKVQGVLPKATAKPTEKPVSNASTKKESLFKKIFGVVKKAVPKSGSKADGNDAAKPNGKNGGKTNGKNGGKTNGKTDAKPSGKPPAKKDWNW